MKTNVLILYCLFCLSSTIAQKATDPLFILQRTPCFGQCPSFTFSLYKNGYAQYSGETFAPLKGKYHKCFSRKEVKHIIEQFNSTDFYKYKNEYTAAVTDLPTTYITYNYKGRHKVVKDYWDAPQSLRNLENLLEKASNSEGWVKDSVQVKK